jgi:HK97 gp10 family phage protein
MARYRLPFWCRQCTRPPRPTPAKEVAAYAANIAPKASGEGAASIHPEWVGDDLEVSWDRDHYYMWFQEHGTVHMPAHPFLEPTLDRYRFY